MKNEIFTSIFFRWPHSAIERPLYIWHQDSLKCNNFKHNKSMEFSSPQLWRCIRRIRKSIINMVDDCLTCQSRHGVSRILALRPISIASFFSVLFYFCSLFFKSFFWRLANIWIRRIPHFFLLYLEKILYISLILMQYVYLTFSLLWKKEHQLIYLHLQDWFITNIHREGRKSFCKKGERRNKTNKHIATLLYSSMEIFCRR